jgi:hypothetical protein
MNNVLGNAQGNACGLIQGTWSSLLHQPREIDDECGGIDVMLGMGDRNA